MLKDPRNLLWIVPLVAVLTMPLWKPLATGFLSPVRQKTGSGVSSLSGPLTLGSSEMSGVRFEQSDNGARTWLLTASRLNSRENEADMRLEDVKARFFSADGRKEKARISSQRARYNADANKITLQGGVVVQDENGYRMQTESLEYLAARKKIRTTSAVTILGSNIKVTGNRLLYDIPSGNYKLEGNVKCRMW